MRSALIRTGLSRPRAGAFAAILASTILAAACASASPNGGGLTTLCSGVSTSTRLRATVDTVRGPGGPALTSLRGRSFELRLLLSPPARVNTGSSSGCADASGVASFAGDLPDRIRSATSSTGNATWRFEGDTMLLDLNPGARDNNVFVVLPIHGGRGHWGLSTFAGEVAGGSTEPLPQR